MSTQTLRLLILVASLSLLLLVTPIAGQTVTGTLQGTVTDANGAVVPGATVTVVNTETGQQRILKTNSDGFYVAAFLPLGLYNMSVALDGFSPLSKEGIEITLNQTRVFDFALNPTGAKESVLVNADTAPLNTTNAEIKGTLNAQEILDKPTFNQSNFLTLAETFGGFQENPTLRQNNPVASTGSSLTGDVLVANHPNNAPGMLYALTGLPANDPRRVDVRGQTLRLAADAQCAGTLAVQGIGATIQCPVAVPIGNFEYSFRLPRTDELRPDGRYATNALISNNTWSYYHGLQAEWTKRLSRGLTFQAVYTWSKAIDTTSEATNLGMPSTSSGGDTNNTGNAAGVTRGLSHFDTRHRLTFVGTYNLPFWHSLKGFFDNKGLTIFSGWTVATVVRLSKGTPFTIFNSNNGNGYGDLNFDGFTELQPALVDPSLLGRRVTNPHDPTQLIPSSAFRTPTVADFGRQTPRLLARNQQRRCSTLRHLEPG